MSKKVKWDYEAGLKAMDAQLTDPDARQAFEELASALRENLRKEKLFGRTPAGAADRAEIVLQLNQLALDKLRVPFNNLCQVKTDRG